MPSTRKGRREKASKKPKTSGGGLKEYAKDVGRRAKVINANMRTARKYVTEDVKRRVTGEPTQRQERESAKAKVGKMRSTAAARGGRVFDNKPFKKKAYKKTAGNAKALRRRTST